jgi:hypothetical protein
MQGSRVSAHIYRNICIFAGISAIQIQCAIGYLSKRHYTVGGGGGKRERKEKMRKGMEKTCVNGQSLGQDRHAGEKNMIFVFKKGKIIFYGRSRFLEMVADGATPSPPSSYRVSYISNNC